MIFHFAILFWTLAFYLVLEFLAEHPIDLTWTQYALSLLPLAIIALLASRRLTGRFSDAFLPGLLSITAPTLLLLVDHPMERRAFVVISALMYYAALLGIYRLRFAQNDQTARAFLHSAAMAASFFFYASVYGFYLNFNFPLWGLMLIFAFGTIMTSFATFVGAEGSSEGDVRRRRMYSVLLGFIMGEMGWVVSFWPFGYLTAGALLLVFFFVIWDVALDGLKEKLSLRKTIARLVFLSVLSALLLASSPWRILV
jgi:hypothetical protein